MAFRSSKIPASVLLVVSAIASLRTEAGPVRILDQERTVRAEVNPLGNEPSVVDERSAPDAAAFSAIAVAAVSLPDFTGDARSSVNAALDGGDFRFSGLLRYDLHDTRWGETLDGIPTVRLDYLFKE